MAQTTNKAYTERNVHLAFHSSVPAAAAKSYAGALIGLTGSNGRQLVAADVFVGMALFEVDNAAGAAGDKRIDLVSGIEIEVDVVGAESSAPRTKVYASDSETFTVTAQSNSLVGELTEQVSGTKWKVMLLTPGDVAGV
jgi:hypothetical protein